MNDGALSQPGNGALGVLLGRYSVGPKHLREPGPTPDQILAAAYAATRAPDNQKLMPFRFVRIPPQHREHLAELFVDRARRLGKTPEDLARDRERALYGPCLFAFVVHVDTSNDHVPAYEQWLCAGGALANFLNALHAMGFAAKIVSGAKARDPVISRAFCLPGEQLVGWIAVGTATTLPHPRHNESPDEVLRDWSIHGAAGERNDER